MSGDLDPPSWPAVQHPYGGPLRTNHGLFQNPTVAPVTLQERTLFSGLTLFERNVPSWVRSQTKTFLRSQYSAPNHLICFYPLAELAQNHLATVSSRQSTALPAGGTQTLRKTSHPCPCQGHLAAGWSASSKCLSLAASEWLCQR